jgi:phosphate starvation-inducible PhoH-like protein
MTKKSKKGLANIARKQDQQTIQEAGSKGMGRGKRNKQKVVDARWEQKMEAGGKANVQSEKFQEERKGNIQPLVAQNDNQKLALKAFTEAQLNVLSGSAGTGKTLLAVWWACKQWLDGNVDNIIITRPDKGLGETPPTPGNDTEKLLIFVLPMLMKMKQFLGAGVLRNNLRMVDTDIIFNDASGIQVVPMAKLGGMSFSSKTVVIADEVQAATIPQVKALATRLEEGCQLIITGDTTQSPVKDGTENGLAYLERKLMTNPHELASVVKFTPEDSCRHGITAHLTRIFEEDGTW